MEKDTQDDGSGRRAYRRAVAYYRYARKGHADNERKVAGYFAGPPAVSVAARFHETNPSTRPKLREAIDAARRESVAVLVAGEHRKDRTYEAICGTLARDGVPFVWLGSMWSGFFPWAEPPAEGQDAPPAVGEPPKAEGPAEVAAAIEDGTRGGPQDRQLPREQERRSISRHRPAHDTPHRPLRLQ